MKHPVHPVALHEAGHVVIGEIVCKMQVKRMIVHDPENGGVTEWRPGVATWQGSHRAIVAMAGVCAESLTRLWTPTVTLQRWRTDPTLGQDRHLARVSILRSSEPDFLNLTLGFCYLHYDAIMRVAALGKGIHRRKELLSAIHGKK